MIPQSFATASRLTRAASPLANKFAVITGGSRGIGLAVAHRLSQEGAVCVLVGRDEERLAAAAAQLAPTQMEQSSGVNNHSFVAGDVRHIRTWFAIQQAAPRVDILVNAAGVTQKSLLIHTQFNEIQSILETNLQSAMLGCKSVGRQMIRSKTHGVIVNVSSLLAVRGGHGAAVYAASKAGLIGLTRALVNEMKPFFIRANVVLPGYIKTEMTEDLNEQSITRRIPLGRMGYPEEVADAVSFLVNNKYANNCVLNLDGGLSAV